MDDFNISPIVEQAGQTLEEYCVDKGVMIAADKLELIVHADIFKQLISKIYLLVLAVAFFYILLNRLHHSFFGSKVYNKVHLKLNVLVMVLSMGITGLLILISLMTLMYYLENLLYVALICTLYLVLYMPLFYYQIIYMFKVRDGWKRFKNGKKEE